jgi:transcriptional regulator with XRE-family HTH domain
MAERDFSFLAAQIRAARGLLGWTQGYLAEGVRVSRPTIIDLESGKRAPHENTIQVILSELSAAGINFTKDGVEVRDWPLKPYVPSGIKQRAESAKATKRKSK